MPDVRVPDLQVPKLPAFDLPVTAPPGPLGPLAEGNINVEVREHDNGDVEIVIGDPPKNDEDRNGVDDDFEANLVDKFDADRLAQDLIEGIEADEQSRADWIGTYNNGLKLLGLKPEVTTGVGGLKKNMSTAIHPLLLHSVIMGQSQARAELLPADGPAKVKLVGEQSEEARKRADDLELDFNNYLTTTATEYYPDTDRGLFYLYYGGAIFKKIYRCPLRKRPVSECVYVPDLIISNDVTDLQNARRVTHRFEISRRDLEKLQADGFYADVPIQQPVSQPTSTQSAEAKMTGIAKQVQRPEDVDSTMYECYTYVNPSDYGYDGDGDVSSPYIVTIERDSKTCVAIRRFWNEGDDDRRLMRRRFVKYGLVPGMGYLDYGYVHILGGYAKALTALLRLLIDSGTFANFPGGVRVKGSRLENNEIIAAPGQFPEIETGGLPISDSIMALPFKGPTADMLALFTGIEQQGQQLAGSVTIEVGEGRTNVPVGTIMAQIEQQTQLMAACHKRQHQSQAEEFMLLKELLAEQPELLSNKQQNPVREWTSEELLDASLVPASDPNVPAHVHRIMQAVAVETLFSAHPEYYQGRNVQGFLLDIARLGNKDELLMPVRPQGQDDGSGDMMAQMVMMQGQAEFFKAMLTAQGKQQELMLKKRQMDIQYELDMLDLRLRDEEHKMSATEKAADRQSREMLAQMANDVKIVLERMKQQGAAESDQRQAQISQQQGDIDRRNQLEDRTLDRSASLEDRQVDQDFQREQLDREDKRTETEGQRKERLEREKMKSKPNPKPASGVKPTARKPNGGK